MTEAAPGSLSQALSGPQGATTAGKTQSRSDAAAPRGFRRLWYRSRLYHFYLGFERPRGFAVAIDDPWPGSPERGDDLFHGRFRFAGQQFAFTERVEWAPADAREAWLEGLHGFAWLRDFRASGGEIARRHARTLVADWCVLFGRWHPVIWRPDLCGSRIAAWCAAGSFLLQGAKPEFESRFFAALGRQARHLFRAGNGSVVGSTRFTVIRGLLAAAVGLGWAGARLRRIETMLREEIDRQILGDGGHIERSPSLQRQVLGDLAECRAILLAANRPPPERLLNAIDRMAPMLRTLRHGDGGLALFNDSAEEEPWLIDATLTIADARGRALANAPHAGFQRMAARRTLVLVDAGTPAPLPDHVHAGTLSVEMSVGKQRVIVNCGPHHGQSESWAAAIRGSAAHSTLTVDDTNIVEFRGDGTIGRKPLTVACMRNDQDDACWLDLSHDGYLTNFGIIHQRRLYMAADGDDFRGEDSLLTQSHGREPAHVSRGFAVRFHLHPSVRASLIQDGRAVLLRLADGSGWQFRASGGALSLEGSIYFGDAVSHRRSEQIVVTGRTDQSGALVKWGLRRMGLR